MVIVRKDGWIEKLAIEYLGGKCSHCGYDDHYAAMQFHHETIKILRGPGQTQVTQTGKSYTGVG